MRPSGQPLRPEYDQAEFAAKHFLFSLPKPFNSNIVRVNRPVASTGVRIWKETASGGKGGRPERKQVMALAFNRYLAEVGQCLQVFKGRIDSLIAQPGSVCAITARNGRSIIAHPVSSVSSCRLKTLP